MSGITRRAHVDECGGRILFIAMSSANSGGFLNDPMDSRGAHSAESVIASS
jgi:hypothetical protein